ncbi:hypothetical protein CH305_18365 [Rhodococcus sp. 15-649-2-2]|uniref:hypothetical protein n=1 Tax=Rhodococcus sp. 15-649-2-2 TaxID=2023140 RepID=UPI000B9B5B1C|nr:hypothetical protein [Rhodococcus sp. 15-649-2-2]OZE77202.1 hypothetical protein CH305_18365 [Rhodococcus sp. 15-649-2-2]
MTYVKPQVRIAAVLGKHYAVSFGLCLCGWRTTRTKIGESWRPEFDEHQAELVAALPDIEIVPAGTSTAMGAFAAGSVTKQRVLEDIAYVLTGWRYEEPEDTWAAVAAIAKGMGNGALVAEIEKSYTADEVRTDG